MSALQKENPRKPLAKAKPKLRQNVLREKLKKQRQELANDVIALESNIVTKAARELDDQRAAASEMAQRVEVPTRPWARASSRVVDVRMIGPCDGPFLMRRSEPINKGNAGWVRRSCEHSSNH